MAAFCLQKYGTAGSKLAREAAPPTEAEDDDTQCYGERTREERDEEGKRTAIDLDSEDEAVCGGIATGDTWHLIPGHSWSSRRTPTD